MIELNRSFLPSFCSVTPNLFLVRQIRHTRTWWRVVFKKLRASHSTASLPNQQQQQQSDDKFDKNIFRQKREKDTRIKSLAQTKQNKNTSLSNSTSNHLRPTRRTIIFVKSDKQSSLSNSTNDHPCQIRQTILSQSRERIIDFPFPMD